MKLYKKLYGVCIYLLVIVHCSAQITSVKLKEFISSPLFSSSGLQYPKLVKEFYIENNYRLCWIGQETNIKILQNFLEQSSQLALRQEDYNPAMLKNYAAGDKETGNKTDTPSTELKFTDAAIHFLHDVLMGNKQEAISYNGLNYTPSCFEIPALLNNYLEKGRLSFLLKDTELKDAEYLAIKNKIIHFSQTVSAPGFKDVKLLSSKTGSNTGPLIIRLYQLGIIASDTVSFSEAEIKLKIKQGQKMFSLFSDGTLRSTTLEAFNVPLAQRLQQLQSLLNSIRWLNCIKQSNHIIVVNIPSATLLLYEHGKIVLESRLIVGKKSTPTPTLNSTITEVILYPYWNVPFKITTRELLPIIKLNPGYLDANNYQVLNMQGKVVSPSAIKWHSLSTVNFPYVIRQSTGCDNALGLIKLNFYNPFTVYLHDTPGKSLFNMNKRYFSHGCMRLQKAMEVAHYILRGNSIAIDSLTQKGCLKNQAPITVSATEPIPVFVLYHTAWIDAASKISFHEDVYDREK